MSVSRPGSMRGPLLKTPLLLLLLLLSAGTVLCQFDSDGIEPEAETETVETAEEEPAEQQDPQDTDPPPTDLDTTPALDLLPAEEEFPVENTVDLESTVDGDLGSGSTESSGDPALEDPTDGTGDDEGLNPIIILVPVVLAVLIISMIVCGIFISRKCNKKAKSQSASVATERALKELEKEDPYLDQSSTEKVPMPMFEEDVPSVLELEMEELGQWMQKDSGTTEETAQA